MDLPKERIIMDPLTSPSGYGLEYTYSIMERDRLTGMGGDPFLCAPIMANIGNECSKVKEYKAPETAFPAWGSEKSRPALWEIATATSLLLSGTDLLIMYHPVAVETMKKTIAELMEGK
jgi:acetyl-CoA decarbonylase/synthase complex subunit delta